MTSEVRITQFQSLTLQWLRFGEFDRNRQNRGYRLYVEQIEIAYMSHIDQSVRNDHSAVFCPKDNIMGQLLPNKNELDYIRCNKQLLTWARDRPSNNLVPLSHATDLHNIGLVEGKNPVFNKVPGSYYSGFTLIY
ncbi:uncharacterized protein LOC128952473 [Oppia nitens]|uniref:uncharacterized protein LOC128952473 n=1 Tax=Oppia nitens TaxID=1686743 RepID=UPI0023DA0058|nr:uncharacterized protein LOC128952473 [Oppia nitens]